VKKGSADSPPMTAATCALRVGCALMWGVLMACRSIQ
jgi:hypothetical protein